MASWVSPSIAAEIWHMPVSDILARVDRGEIQSKTEGDFTFVNIDSSDTGNPKAPARLSPPTFSVLTEEEELALLDPVDYQIARKVVGLTRKRPMAA